MVAENSQTICRYGSGRSTGSRYRTLSPSHGAGKNTHKKVPARLSRRFTSDTPCP